MADSPSAANTAVAASKAASVKKAPKLSDFHMVTIRVGEGEDRQTFCVQKAFLCHHSPFFERAFSGNFKEGTTQTMELESTTPAVFTLLLNFVYTQAIYHIYEEKPTFELLLMLAIFGDYVLMPELHNKAIQLIKHQILGFQPGDMDINLIDWEWFTENTKAGSPIRRLMVDCLAFDMPAAYLETLADRLPREMLAETSVVNRRYLEWMGSFGDRFVECHDIYRGSRSLALKSRSSYFVGTESLKEKFWWEVCELKTLPALSQRAKAAFEEGNVEYLYNY